MKLKTIFFLTCIIMQVSLLAQTAKYTITCPENTLLGVFSCEDIDNIPQPINTIEAAMAPPYNIQIEGDLPPSTQVFTQDNGVIFFCEDDPRVVTREIVFCAGYFGCVGFEPYEILARCSFTIETIADVTPIDFIAPADELVPCNTLESYQGEVAFIGDDCFAFDQENAFYKDQIRVENETTFVIRTWQTTDACGNISEPQEQIITLDCEQNNNYTVTCPENTFLGVYDCNNIDEVPEPVNMIEEAMAAPYNIQIEGEITSDLRVLTDDDATIFYCPDDARTINRAIIIYKDINFNFVYDIGEEIGSCNYTIETIPDVTPFEIPTIPPDIELACGVEPNTENTGEPYNYVNNCRGTIIRDPIFYADEVTIYGNITTILRSWIAVDPCGNVTEPQIQTITINCESENGLTITCPENTFLGVYDCNNIDEVPLPVNMIEAAMAAPYNIQIEGEITSDLRVLTEDDAIIFICESDARTVNRSIIIYKDLNLNFIYDVGEEIGNCNYMLETIPDIEPPTFTAPLDIEIPCGTSTSPDRTGYVTTIDNGYCQFVTDGIAKQFSDEETTEGDITTVVRTWKVYDFCSNISTQTQTITINCKTECVPPNVGTFDCGN